MAEAGQDGGDADRFGSDLAGMKMVEGVRIFGGRNVLKGARIFGGRNVLEGAWALGGRNVLKGARIPGGRNVLKGAWALGGRHVLMLRRLIAGYFVVHKIDIHDRMRWAPEYMLHLLSRRKPTKVMPDSSAACTARLEGGPTAAIIVMPAVAAFWMSSKQARPLRMRMEFVSGRLLRKKQSPMSLSRAL